MFIPLAIIAIITGIEILYTTVVVTMLLIKLVSIIAIAVINKIIRCTDAPFNSVANFSPINVVIPKSAEVRNEPNANVAEHSIMLFQETPFTMASEKLSIGLPL